MQEGFFLGYHKHFLNYWSKFNKKHTKNKIRTHAVQSLRKLLNHRANWPVEPLGQQNLIWRSWLPGSYVSFFNTFGFFFFFHKTNSEKKQTNFPRIEPQHPWLQPTTLPQNQGWLSLNSLWRYIQLNPSSCNYITINETLKQSHL